MSNPITVKGYVCSVPRAADARQASVAVVQTMWNIASSLVAPVPIWPMR